MIESRASRTFALAAAALLLWPAAPALGAEDSEAAQAQAEESFDWVRVPEAIFDILVLRPLGLAATVAGLPMFVASAPLLGPSGEYLTSWDVFVQAPAEYTFTRPLGDF